MRFLHWGFLFLLLLLPLLHVWWKRRSSPAPARFPLRLNKSLSLKNPLLYLLLLKYAALACFIVALARPQLGYRQTERSVEGVDIMLVLDVSASMNAEDLANASRLDVAKQTMERFIKGRPNDRIGLVVFSGEPLTMAPPTLDSGLLMKALKDSATGVLRDGTAIGDGLSLTVSHLRNSTAKSRVIVLLTDGDNNMGQIDPMTAGELAKGYGIKVYTIAVGRDGRVKIPFKGAGVFGGTVYQWMDNSINPQLLQNIAQMTQGKFYRVSDANALEEVFHEIDSLEKTKVQTVEKTKYEEIYHKPLNIGVLLLIIEQLLSRGWWRLLP